MNTPGTSQTTLRDLLGNLRTGLLVVADELKWIVLRGLRSLEIRQMEKRLAEEQAALGQAVAEAVAGQEAPASAPLALIGVKGEDASGASLEQPPEETT